MVNAIKGCEREDAQCQADLVNKSGPDAIIGFEGFKDRQAVFELKIKDIN